MDMMPMLETVEIPSLRPMIISAAMMTSPVVWESPATMQSASSNLTIMAAKLSGSFSMRFTARAG